MLANLPVEIVLLICEYPEFKDLGQLAWTNKRMMQIIKKHRPIVLEIELERKILFYLQYEYKNSYRDEGRIYLFDSHTNSVEQIAKFDNWYWPYQVASTKDRIFGIDNETKSFEIYDLNTRQISRGPDLPEWRIFASVAYFKDKLYYLGGRNPEKNENTNQTDVLIDGKWQTGPTFPFPIEEAQTITCNGILYVFGGYPNKMIYQLSQDEREWIKIGEIPRSAFGVASLNGKIYITGGVESLIFSVHFALESCLCFDPSAPVDSRISRIAGMNYERKEHSLVVANGKLYAIGGFQKPLSSCCNSIEEYNPQTNKWRKVGNIDIK